MNFIPLPTYIYLGKGERVFALDRKDGLVTLTIEEDCEGEDQVLEILMPIKDAIKLGEFLTNLDRVDSDSRKEKE